MPDIVSVSWGDHLLFGEGDGRLATTQALRRRMGAWRDELGASTVHWRASRSRRGGRYYRARRYPRTIEERQEVEWDDLLIVPQLAHEMGMRAYLYVPIFDEGRPLPSKRVRQVGGLYRAMRPKTIKEITP